MTMEGEAVTVESIAQAIRARYETTPIFGAESAAPMPERCVEDKDVQAVPAA
jgi:hypothetical protein